MQALTVVKVEKRKNLHSLFRYSGHTTFVAYYLVSWVLAVRVAYAPPVTATVLSNK